MTNAPDNTPTNAHQADDAPLHLDLVKDKALTVQWKSGKTSVYPIAWLRKHSPSADARELRKQMSENPLTVLPAGAASQGPLVATKAELVGRYALRLTFSDGHHTGLYSWSYLKKIDPDQPKDQPIIDDEG